MSTHKFVAFLGDSITEGFGITTKPWPQLIHERRAGTNFAIANHANSGEKIADICTRYDDQVAGRGYTHVVFGPLTNDFPDGTTGAVIYAALLVKAQAALAAGMGVVLCKTLPRKNGAAYSGGLQTQVDAFNALLEDAPNADLPGAYVVDFYTAMGDPGDAQALKLVWTSDGLHPIHADAQEAMADEFDASVSL
jgi:lysophospholipase L1-like esterase